MYEPPPFYKGPEGFSEVLANERLCRPGRAIRVYNYENFSGNERLLVIGTDRQLFDATTGNKVNPQEVLSRESAPNGWSVEGLEIALLPQSEITKIITNYPNI
ncbi:MAG: hypothetical protein AABX11_02735 [Nanoarchaeota archaeon]